MKTFTIVMPQVSKCMVNECSYNMDNKCHARAITIGDSVRPGCDTFNACGTHANRTQITAGIGACKTATCKHNEDFECMADSVQVGMIKNEANCMTFAMR